jgi:ABC-type lipoprotein export system ATPase subunit
MPGAVPQSPEPNAPPLLTADRVEKRYGNRTILDRLSFTLAAGERIALMGPSGAGKSTLLNCLGGIEPLDGGTIHFDGDELSRLDSDAVARLRRRAIGTVFQFFHLLPTLTAAENIALPLHLNGVPKAERAARVAALLDEVGVTHRADAFPEALSGGEMQRVAIARALATEPKLLLADEPTGNLDSKTGETVLDLIKSLSERHRTALVMVTHSLASTRICDRVLHMRDGRIVRTDAAER